ncbi:MAG: BamA/TamA family outer membrane protein [Candidatus Zixiibacteriota bacterium]
MISNKYPLVIILLILITPCLNAEDKYKKYERQIDLENYMQISLVGKTAMLTLYAGDTSQSFRLESLEDNRSDREIGYQGENVLNKDGFVMAGTVYPFDMIDRTEITFDDKETRITFLQKDPESGGNFRNRKKNVVSVFENIDIAPGDFIRGSLVSFWANITLNGEINEDVIAIYGDISVGQQAVVRGDIIALNGSVDIAKGATVYGRVQASGGKKKLRFDRWTRWHKKEKDFSTIIRFYYDRVDGATPLLGVQFTDEDSLLPRVEIYSGYAFSSEQWRYYIGVEQSFWLQHPITFGASLYRKLATQDDWIMKRDDNTVFALLATEDYRDYYETEGGYIFGRFTPFSHLNLEMGALIEEYHWLDAHTDLWSMFGGSKTFRCNFGTVPMALRSEGIEALDEAEMASIVFKAGFDNSDDEERFEHPFWMGKAELEILPDAWNDDFDFTRYIVRAGRFQNLNDYSGLYMKAGYGGSDGQLPLHRRYFLGGLESLMGYSHKEYTGQEYWFGNIEYRLKFPKTDVTGSLFYNAGQIAEEAGKLGDAEVKQSIGVGICFEESLRLDLARRLDQSGSSFKVYVRLGFNF